MLVDLSFGGSSDGVHVLQIWNIKLVIFFPLINFNLLPNLQNMLIYIILVSYMRYALKSIDTNLCFYPAIQKFSIITSALLLNHKFTQVYFHRHMYIRIPIIRVQYWEKLLQVIGI